MKLSTILWTLFSLSSALLLLLLIQQTLNIKQQYNKEEIQFNQSEVIDIYQRNFFALNSFTDLELVSNDAQCSKDFSPVFTHSYNRASSQICKCGDELYLTSCNLLQPDFLKEKACFLQNPKELQVSYALFENTSKELYKGYKMCGKKLKTSDVRFYTQEESKDLPHKNNHKKCELLDTSLIGIVTIYDACPQYSTEFQCKSNQHKIQNGFYIYCSETPYENKAQCLKDEIGCYTKLGKFCLKNTSQCPITDIQIRNDLYVPNGFTESEIHFHSDYNLFVKRNSLEETHISSFLIDSHKEGSYKFSSAIPQKIFNKINRFKGRNEVNEEVIEETQEQAYFEQVHYKRDNIIEKFCQTMDFDEFNQIVENTFNLMYYSRLIFITVLGIKLVLEIVNLLFCSSKDLKDSALARYLYLFNMNLFFFLEIAILIMVLTLFNKGIQIPSEYDQDNCIYQVHKRSILKDVENINNMSLITIIVIIAFAVIKATTIFTLIWSKIDKTSVVKQPSQSSATTAATQTSYKQEMSHQYTNIQEAGYLLNQ